MSLNATDLQSIRQIFQEEMSSQTARDVMRDVFRKELGSPTTYQTIRQIVRDELKPLENEVAALGNDVKEIYNILADNNLQVV